MKILNYYSINENIPEVKCIQIKKNYDERGFFLETYKESEFNNLFFEANQYDIENNFEIKKNLFPILSNPIKQMNESFSKKDVFRGLHIQWNPAISKLVRIVYGHIIDIAMDVRINSPTFGQTVVFPLANFIDQDYEEYIFIPKGFAHGFNTIENSLIQYLYDGEYSKDEVSIKWGGKLLEDSTKFIISDKDKNGISLEEWKQHEGSKNFFYLFSNEGDYRPLSFKRNLVYINIKNKKDNIKKTILFQTSEGIGIENGIFISYQELFDNYVFIDGSICGERMK